MNFLLMEHVIKLLLIFVIISAAIIITRRGLGSLVLAYQIQSLLLAFIAVVLFLTDGNIILLGLALVTLISKVMIIPYFIRNIQRRIQNVRDTEFSYLTPIAAIFVSIAIMLLAYVSLSRIVANQLALSKFFFLGAMIGLSLTLIGNLIMFRRRMVISKTIGYLTMENGVLLISMFVTELPFIIEILIMLDLVILIVLAVLLAFGIDNTIEEFHKKLGQFAFWFKDEEP